MSHRQVALTIPKWLRVFFHFDRRLLGELLGSIHATIREFLAKQGSED